MTEQARFRKQLLETMAWCAPRIGTSEVKTSLRSSELRPDVDFDEDGVTVWAEPSMIDRVVDVRAQVTADAGRMIVGGRLLLCDYEATNHNWASTVASQWFFDGHDNPPWDTWVGRYYDALVAWVPPAFLHLAQAGIDVECMGMLQWADGPTDANSRTPSDWLNELALEVRGHARMADPFLELSQKLEFPVVVVSPAGWTKTGHAAHELTDASPGEDLRDWQGLEIYDSAGRRFTARRAFRGWPRSRLGAFLPLPPRRQCDPRGLRAR